MDSKNRVESGSHESTSKSASLVDLLSGHVRFDARDAVPKGCLPHSLYDLRSRREVVDRMIVSGVRLSKRTGLPPACPVGRLRARGNERSVDVLVLLGLPLESRSTLLVHHRRAGPCNARFRIEDHIKKHRRNHLTWRIPYSIP